MQLQPTITPAKLKLDAAVAHMTSAVCWRHKRPAAAVGTMNTTATADWMEHHPLFQSTVSGYCTTDPQRNQKRVRTYVSKINKANTFGPFKIHTSEAALIRAILSEKPENRNWCSTHCSDDRLRLYFDCDLKLEPFKSSMQQQQQPPNKQEWLDAFLQLVKHVFEKQFPGRTLNLDEAVWVFDASSTTKISLHIHFPAGVIFSNYQSLRAFCRLVKQHMRLVAPWKDCPNEECWSGFLDLAVYNSFGQMRLPLNRKPYPEAKALTLLRAPASYGSQLPTAVEQIRAGLVVATSWKPDELLTVAAVAAATPRRSSTPSLIAAAAAEVNDHALHAHGHRLDEPDNPVVELIRTEILAPLLGPNVQLRPGAGCYEDAEHEVVWKGVCVAKTAICIACPKHEYVHRSNSTAFCITENSVFVRCLSTHHKSGKQEWKRTEMTGEWQQWLFGMYDDDDEEEEALPKEAERLQDSTRHRFVVPKH